MYYSELNADRFEGFAVPSEADALEALDEKYERFQRAGAALVRLETDWDDTIGQGTWPIVRSAISDMAASAQKKMYANNRSPLHNGLLKFSQSWTWQVSALGTLVGQRIEPILEAAHANNGSVREGARELYETCRERDIPFIVKSASTRQVIEAAAEAGGIKPDVIIATELLTDGETPYEGTITGWVPATMTHSHNKAIITSEKLVAIEQARPHVIGLGSKTIDRMMTHPGHDSLWVSVNNNYQDNEKREAYLAQSFSDLRTPEEGGSHMPIIYPPYDLVSIEPNLMSTNALLREIAL